MPPFQCTGQTDKATGLAQKKRQKAAEGKRDSSPFGQRRTTNRSGRDAERPTNCKFLYRLAQEYQLTDKVVRDHLPSYQRLPPRSSAGGPRSSNQVTSR